MSYLNNPKLVFSGDFLSDVSTVNNDVAHYNNETFQKSFQEFGKGAVNGWWNPEGGAIFDFKNTRVQQLFYADGTVENDSNLNELIGQIVTGAEGRATGKMVDLDPQQQMVSELWSVKLRILTASNELLLEGSIDPAGFRDLQYRQHAGAQINGQPLGGTWTSVLTDLVWGEKYSDNRFFKELKETTHHNKLSINLNGFGYYYNHATDGRFSLGKIIGAIGPWFENEPLTFAPNRRLYGTVNSSSTSTQVFFSTTNFIFEKENKRLTIDFGSSFPVENSIGSVSYMQKLILGVSNSKLSNSISNKTVVLKSSDFTEIAPIDYTPGDWLLKTGGMINIENLPDKIVEQLVSNQLILVTPSTDNNFNLIAREAIDGYLVRADNFVQRIDYNQTNDISIYAYQWGKPIKNAQINLTLDPKTPSIPKGPKSPICVTPGNNFPQDGLGFKPSIQINNGLSTLQLTGNKINEPRDYIDGQIYFLNYAINNINTDPAIGPFTNDSISIHLRSYYEIPETPTWQDISQIMIQFSNLYPIMSKYLVDLGDPVALIEKKKILQFAFGQDIKNAMYMPVTRDLSETKRAAILKWLSNPIIESPDKTTKVKAQKTSLKESNFKTGQELTQKQKNIKNASLMKNGSFIKQLEIKTLKY